MRIGFKCDRIDCGAGRFPTGSKTVAEQVVAACKDGNPLVSGHVDYAENRKHLGQIEGHHSHLGRHDRRKQCVLVIHTCDMRSFGRASALTASEGGVMTDGKTSAGFEGEGGGMRTGRESGCGRQPAEERGRSHARSVVEVEEAGQNELARRLAVPFQ